MGLHRWETFGGETYGTLGNVSPFPLLMQGGLVFFSFLGSCITDCKQIKWISVYLSWSLPPSIQQDHHSKSWRDKHQQKLSGHDIHINTDATPIHPYFDQQGRKTLPQLAY